MPVRAENLRKSEVVHITMAQPAQYIGEHFAEKSYRRFSGRPHLVRLQRRIGTMQAQDHQSPYELGK
jgi:hypothetical protein